MGCFSFFKKISRCADTTQRKVADPLRCGTRNQLLFPSPAGFHELVPPELISIFTPKELELLISGLPDVDVDDLQVRAKLVSAGVACPSCVACLVPGVTSVESVF